MSNNQTLEEVSVNALIERYNLIVPEIQREYVWGHNFNNILDSFFKDIKEGLEGGGNRSALIKKADKFLDTALNNADNDIRDIIETLRSKLLVGNQGMNIGFLYSYRPDYFVFNDRNEDIYLIDGQQRFTTLFLMLFYFSVRENKQDDFFTLFRFDEHLERMAFDYRVRTLTHNFFIDLVSQTNQITDIAEINKKNWFLSNYNDDPTIRAVVYGLFPALDRHFGLDARSYYDFLKHNVKFWHFRTEETSQGEELYITMNSRGQQLADNENIRAALFEPEAIRKAGKTALIWSERWEVWQDFFWKKRKKDPKANADAGFNEFLRWVQICTMTERERLIIDDEDEEALDKKEIIRVIKWEDEQQLDITYLTLQDLDDYFEALHYLYETFPKSVTGFKSKFHTYQDFDLLDHGWLAPEGTLSQIELFRLLPVLYYVKKHRTATPEINVETLFRIIRFFYNLRHNDTITKTAGLQTINGLKLIGRLKPADDITVLMSLKANSASIFNTEERSKLQILATHPIREKVEDKFWFAEDMAYNKGEISFLIDWSNANSKGEFNILTFGKMLATYADMISKENEIRGDLLPTKAFTGYWDRVTWNYQFFKEQEFLDYVLARHKSPITMLDDFLIFRRKAFIKKYKSVDDLKAETTTRKQLYIYYIINQNILKKNNHWNWASGVNIGVYTNFNDARTIFNQKYIYQFFRSHFRESYERALWIQRDLRLGSKKIQNLLDWANS